MKKQLQMCSDCEEETWHMIGMKQAHKGDRHYIRRTTSECTRCGKKEVNNKNNGKRIIYKGNESSNAEDANVIATAEGFEAPKGNFHVTDIKQNTSQVKA